MLFGIFYIFPLKPHYLYHKKKKKLFEKKKKSVLYSKTCLFQIFYIIAFSFLKPLQISVLKNMMHLTPAQNIFVLSDQLHGEDIPAQKYDACES